MAASTKTKELPPRVKLVIETLAEILRQHAATVQGAQAETAKPAS